jgi:hypothetical protein
MTLSVERAKRLLHTTIDRRVDQRVPRGVTEPIRGVVTDVFGADHRAMVVLRGTSTAVPVGYPALPVGIVVGDQVVLDRGRDGWLMIAYILGRDADEVGMPSVVIRASGGDDVPAIRAAVQDALPGTRIYLPDAKYLFMSMGTDNVCIDIAGKQNIRFIGRGADKANNGAPDGAGPTTAIIASTGTNGCTMFRWRPLIPNATDANSETYGGGMEGISLGGNSVAAVCQELQGGVNRLMFRNMWVGGATTNAVLTGQGNSSATTSPWQSTYSIRFSDVIFRQYTGLGSSMIILDGNVNGVGGEHTYHFGFTDCTFTYSTGSTAILARATDDIFFDDCGWATSNPNDLTTYPIRFDGTTNGQYSDSVLMRNCYGANLPHMRAEGTGLNRPGRGHFVWPMSMVDSSMRPEWEEGATLWYADTLGRHNLRRDGRTSSDLVDDFMGGQTVAAGGTGGTGIGDLNWTAILGSAGSVTSLDGVANHPGIKRLATGAGASAAILTLRNDNTNRLVNLFASTFFYYCVFRLTANDANTTVRVGFSNAPNVTAPTSGIYIEKLAGESNWFGVVRAASTQNVRPIGQLDAVSAGTGSTNWVKLEIHRRYEGAIGFSMSDQQNHGSQVTLTANEPSGALTPHFMIVNTGSTDSQIDIDYWQLTFHGLVR